MKTVRFNNSSAKSLRPLLHLLCIISVCLVSVALTFTAFAAGNTGKPVITSQPKNYTVSVGGTFYFQAQTDTENAVYQWQSSADGGKKWINSSVKAREYSAVASAAMNGKLYRCVITAPDGSSVTTQAAELTVSATLGVVSQPKAFCGEVGDSVCFEIQAGGENISFQWEKSTDGVQWSAASSSSAGKSYRYKTTAVRSTIGNYYRCVITDKYGKKATSDTVRILLNKSGFIDYYSNRIYMYYDGKIPTGITEIGGKYYYFSKTGVALSGFFDINGERYYFNGETGMSEEGFISKDIDGTRFTYFVCKNGKVKTGWINYNGKKYYGTKNRYIAYGLTNINGNSYYFDFDTGEQKTGLIKVGIDTYMYFGGSDGRVLSGKKTIGGKTYYFSEESESFGVALSGIISLDGGLYYFRDDYTLNSSKGFFTFSGNVYCSDENGKCYTGLNNIDGKLYLFDENGIMKTGERSVDGDFYCFKDTGEAVTGWYDAADGYRYYYMPDSGKMVKEDTVIDGVTYYFLQSGRLRTGLFGTKNGTYYFSPDGKTYSGWLEDDGKKYYVNSDHTVATGLKVIDGERYYFSSSGVMQTGYRVISGKKYYFEPYATEGFRKADNGNTYYFRKDGKILSGLLNIDGKLYCLAESGILLYGKNKIDGKVYFFDENTGVAKSGWIAIRTSAGNCYMMYFDSETFCAFTGLKQIDGKTYYFSGSGFMLTGLLKVNNKLCLFDEAQGNVYTGFYYDESDKQVLYFDGINGIVKGPCIKQINGKYYCITSGNYLGTGICTVNSKKYYFNPGTGELFVGFFKSGDDIYYSDGLNGIVTGTKTIDGNVYNFGSYGKLIHGIKYENGKPVYYDDNTGIRTYGVVTDSDSGVRYYISEDGSCGKVIDYCGVEYSVSKSCTFAKGYVSTSGTYFDTETGERQFGLISFSLSSGAVRTYYFSESGVNKNVTNICEALQKLKKTNGWKTYKSETYYVKNGEFLKGLQTLKGTDGKTHTYYFSNLSGAMLTGLRSIGGSQYLFDSKSGAMLTGAQLCDGKEYYFDSQSGKRITGIVRSGNILYCYLNGSGMLKSCTVCINGRNYTFDKNGSGKLLTEKGTGNLPGMNVKAFEWITEGNKKYFTDASGKAISGVHIIQNNIYYFNENGLYTGEVDGKYYTADGMKTGFVTISGKTYYFDPVSGSKRYGEIIIEKSLYYFDPLTGEMRTGWVNGKYYLADGKNASGWFTLDGNRYWFDKNGNYATGITEIPDEGTYIFDDSGRMLTGLIKYGDKLYYAEPGKSGYGKLKTGLVKSGGKLYYFDEDEFYAASGMKTVDEHCYYFNPLTHNSEYGIISVGKNRYHFIEDGKGQSFGLVKFEDGSVRYFDEFTGVMKTGLCYVDSVYFYFDPDTGISVKKMVKDASGIYYCINAGGGRLYGMQNIDGKDFYFNTKNGQAVFGLNSIGYKLYYFDEVNGMVKNSTVQVGTLEFKADATGALSVVGNRPIDRLVASGINKIGAPYYDSDTMSVEAAAEIGEYSCSSLVKTVFADAGINIPYVCDRQYYTVTHTDYEYELIKSLDEAQPGDIIYVADPECSFGDDCGFWGELHHVAVYIGDGKVLEASGGDGSTNGGMVIHDFYETNKETFISAIVRLKSISTDKEAVYSEQMKLSAEHFTYNGSMRRPKVTLTNGAGKILVKDTDYTVTYSNSSAACGTYSVTVECKGAYTGKLTKYFTVEPADIGSFAVSLSSTAFTYNASAKKPTVTLKNSSGRTLTNGTSYTVKYCCINGCKTTGTHTVTITGAGNYTGSLTKTFKIGKQSLVSSRITLSATSYTYTGKVKKPTVTVKTLQNTTLGNGSSYVLKCCCVGGCKTVGTHTLTITGTGNYTGTVTKTFRISKQALAASRVTLSATAFTYTGTAKKPTATVKTLQGTTLGNGSSYTVTYCCANGCKTVGTHTITVTGIGNYTGTVTKTFKISKQALLASRVTLSATAFTYTGTAKKPTVTVKTLQGTALTKDSSYTVTYCCANGCKKAGTHKVTVTAKGNYTGSVTKTFTIK